VVLISLKKIEMLKYIIIIALLFNYTATNAQQNVVILIADDLGTDYCGFYTKHTDTIAMPNIRQLVAQGVTFTKAWSTPFCSSTRAGILTGRYGFRTGIGTVISSNTSADLSTSEISLAYLFKNKSMNKYATANVGKWHINTNQSAKWAYPNLYFGYDYYRGNFSGALPDFYNYKIITQGDTTTCTNYATSETVSNALNWLDTLPNNKPFFLWVAFNAPHSPYHKPPDSLHNINGLTGTTAHINANTQKYFTAMAQAMDTEIGRLISYLKSINKYDSTTFVFIGDNGTVSKLCLAPDSTKCKGTVYEPGVHIPMVIAGPQVVSKNRYSHALVNTIDIFSTVLACTNYNNWQTLIPSTTIVDSKNILPILKNTADSIRPWIFTELFTTPSTTKDAKAIRNLKYKLIHFDNGTQEMYNLNIDSNEVNNLLLSSTLSTEELSNYHYLCNELSSLLGKQLCEPLKVTTHNINAITIVPNPANNYFLINTNFATNYTIYNLQGQAVLKGNTAFSKQVSTAVLSNGIYYLQMQNANYKLIVQH
jgi:arylsulfatase B